MNKSVKIKIGLNDYQISKLKRAFKKNEPVSLKFSNKQLQEDTYEVNVSVQQMKRLISAMKSKAKRGIILKLTNKQVGGFLPALMPLLPTLISGVLSGAAGYGTTKALDAITGNGLYRLGQTGKGVKKKNKNF